MKDMLKTIAVLIGSLILVLVVLPLIWQTAVGLGIVKTLCIIILTGILFKFIMSKLG